MKVLSPTFGTIALYHVESGAVVAEGDPICEIEVMKTFYRVEAPCAGTLVWIFELGAVIGEGDVIGEIV